MTMAPDGLSADVVMSELLTPGPTNPAGFWVSGRGYSWTDFDAVAENYTVHLTCNTREPGEGSAGEVWYHEAYGDLQNLQGLYCHDWYIAES